MNPCRHYWIIEPANGPISKGRCRGCGEEREFSNSSPLSQASWDEDTVKKNHTQICAPRSTMAVFDVF